MTELGRPIGDYAEVWCSTQDGLYYVRTKADNGQIILTSEGYKTKTWATKVAEDTGLPVKEVEDA